MSEFLYVNKQIILLYFCYTANFCNLEIKVWKYNESGYEWIPYTESYDSFRF